MDEIENTPNMEEQLELAIEMHELPDQYTVHPIVQSSDEPPLPVELAS